MTRNQATSSRLWLARGFVGIVLFINLQCALLFIWRPQDYSPGFELTGAVGAAAVRGMGVLFLMWNVPYVFATLHPRKYRTSLYEAIIMQTIGVIGETLILWSLPELHQLARLTVTRFILFDACGLMALCLATWLTRAQISSKPT